MVGFVGFILFTASAAADARPAVLEFTEQASRQWVGLLDRARREGATIDGLTGDLGEAGAPHCAMRVLKPEFEAPPLSDPTNRIECEGSYALSLAAVPIESWGNRFDHRGVSFKGGLAVQLFGLFQRSVLEGDELFSRMTVCDPNGVYCREDIILSQAPDHPEEGQYSMLQVSCLQESENDQVIGTRCLVFPRQS